MPGLFVTGTGTGVGKTFVTAGLLHAARRAGRPVDALKPIVSGYTDADAAHSDAGILLAALGRPITPDALAAISPWRFAAPLSPDMAAAAEGRRLDLADVTAACRAAVRADRTTLIEGVGGVMVPLEAPSTVLDLMAALALPILLVSSSELGAISHCLTAVTALRSRGLVPEVIVLNETAGSTVPLEATARTLRAFCPDQTFVFLPRAPAPHLFDDLLAHLVE